MENDDPDMDAKLWRQGELKARGRGAAKDLAEYLGIEPKMLSKMMPNATERRSISASHLMAMERYFGTSPSQAMQDPLVGYIGAGAEVAPDFEQVPPEGLEQIGVPFKLPDEMIAFRVVGDSQFPKYEDGDTLIVYREQHRPIDHFLGIMAAVCKAHHARHRARHRQPGLIKRADNRKYSAGMGRRDIRRAPAGGRPKD